MEDPRQLWAPMRTVGPTTLCQKTFVVVVLVVVLVVANVTRGAQRDAVVVAARQASVGHVVSIESTTIANTTKTKNAQQKHEYHRPDQQVFQSTEPT